MRASTGASRRAAIQPGVMAGAMIALGLAALVALALGTGALGEAPPASRPGVRVPPGARDGEPRSTAIRPEARMPDGAGEPGGPGEEPELRPSPFGVARSTAASPDESEGPGRGHPRVPDDPVARERAAVDRLLSAERWQEARERVRLAREVHRGSIDAVAGLEELRVELEERLRERARRRFEEIESARAEGDEERARRLCRFLLAEGDPFARYRAGKILAFLGGSTPAGED